jgi:hypothetical protein
MFNNIPLRQATELVKENLLTVHTTPEGKLVKETCSSACAGLKLSTAIFGRRRLDNKDVHADVLTRILYVPSNTLSAMSDAFFGSVTSLASNVSELFDIFDAVKKEYRFSSSSDTDWTTTFEIYFSGSSDTNHDSLL